jgi:alcohol dehydrogenase
MKAVVLKEKGQLALEDVPEPQLKENSDVIVRVTTAAICGSDIHIKHGLVPGVAPGTIMGHEFMGVIDRTGSEVTRFKPGDRVAVPAAVWCGICPACRRGEVEYCANGGVWGGGELFSLKLSGVQTVAVRVPFADVCLTSIPDSVPDEQAVFVGDVFSTGYHAAHEGHITIGDSVVIFGCGPIGLTALVSARQFGPKQVLAIDRLPNRLALAKHFGGLPIDASKGPVVEQIQRATGGAGADVVIEAVGSQETFLDALRSVRRGGAVSVVGLFPGPVDFPLHELVLSGLRLSMGLGNLSRMNQLMALIESGRVDLSPLVTHTFALDDALEAYDLFENHKEKCIKVVLKP